MQLVLKKLLVLIIYVCLQCPTAWCQAQRTVVKSAAIVLNRQTAFLLFELLLLFNLIIFNPMGMI